METPIYIHDCDDCIFLGNFETCESGKNEKYDLYFCENGPTVIARYGDKGWEYASGLRFANPDGTPSLYEAKLRAIKKGLYIDK